jgi:hypothetical protein
VNLLSIFIGAVTAMPSMGLLAQIPPPTPCGNLPGCGGPDPILLTVTLPAIAFEMMRIAGVAGFLAVLWAGYQMVLSRGKSDETTNARWAIIFAITGVAIAFTSQLMVSFVATEDYGQNAPGDLLYTGIIPAVVRILLTLLNAIFLIMIIIAGYRFMSSAGRSEEGTEAKAMITWSIVGAIIVNLSHAIIQGIITFFELGL